MASARGTCAAQEAFEPLRFETRPPPPERSRPEVARLLVDGDRATPRG